MYETFDHTADIGIRVRAKSLPALLTDAARGLFSLIVTDPGAVQPVEEMRLRINGDDPEYLLFDWLSELLFLFDTRHLVPAEIEVHVDEHRLQGLDAIVRGERIEPGARRLDHEIKAITYHGLKVDRTTDGWFAEVIVDV